MNLTKILTIVLLLLSLYLAWFLYSGVQKTIDDRESISTREALVIERLSLIREAEVVFQEVNGRYTANWDSLANFIENGQVPILERREEIKQKAYGGEEVILHIDTLGFVPAKERIFKKNYNLNAADNGVFMGFKFKVGDRVIKNQKAYSLKVGERVNEPPFQDQGLITTVANVNPGDAVKKGQVLATFWEYMFKPNVDIKKIGIKPTLEGIDEKPFIINVNKVDKSGVMVQVIEVIDPTPDNPLRKESNDARPRKPLRFGSLNDVSTAGNWE